MKAILEDLWCSYVEENDPKSSYEEKIALDIMEKAEKRLRKGLNDAQIKLLDEYIECWGELCAVYRKESFIKGVRFATKYLLEATE